MAFEVQDSDDPTATANAYVSVAEFQAYCDERGIDHSAKTDPQIEQAIVRATDYMDGRWTYEGFKYDIEQSTEVPRRDVFDSEGFAIDDIPRIFKNACCEYTQIDLIVGETLMPNSQNNTQSGQLTYERKKVDAVEKEIHYHANRGFQWPRWPLPDRMMRQSGLIGSTRRQLGRG
ncbi:MAG: hypothetical protein KAS32_00890 [Candidatus Peribacteraceae bacterium]|nr:hypothetical protein [Candidatus Peribacteraceae bacterium]